MSKDKLSNGSITIDGLTQEQVILLNVMWTIETEEELYTWKEKLSLRQSKMVEALMVLILLEQLDADMIEEPDYSDASEILGKFTLH
jgi:hypothetical protein